MYVFYTPIVYEGTNMDTFSHIIISSYMDV